MRALGASRTSLVPGGVLAGPWVRNDLWRRARAVPSLDLRFADNKSLVDAVTGASLVTFTRASSGTYVGSDGVIQTAATDVPRFDHNPTTGESLGLLVEEQRTNSIRNNTMVGAVAGTPGTLPTNWLESIIATGLTRQVVGTGTSNGVTYIDVKVSGTTSNANGWSIFFDASTQIAASSGQVWAGASYVAIIAGSTANITDLRIRIVERNSGGGYITENNVSCAAATTSLINNRFSLARTLGATAAFVQYGLYFQAASGVAIDITLRIGLPQLEQGAFATSVILTTAAAATRSADVASITGSAFSGWYRQDAQTWYGEYAAIYTASATIPANAPHLMQVYTAASANNNYAIRGAESNIIQLAVARNPTSGVQFPGITLGFALAGQSRRLAYAINSTELQLAGMGVLGGLATNNSAALMATHDILSIGSGTGGAAPQQANGHIRRLTFWGQRLPPNILQGITQ